MVAITRRLRNCKNEGGVLGTNSVDVRLYIPYNCVSEEGCYLATSVVAPWRYASRMVQESPRLSEKLVLSKDKQGNKDKMDKIR